MGAGMASEGDTLPLGDGRRLGYAYYGRPDGEPVFYFHGHPGSRLEARFAAQAAAGTGLRVIALDRPGYGLSDFQQDGPSGTGQPMSPPRPTGWASAASRWRAVPAAGRTRWPAPRGCRTG